MAHESHNNDRGVTDSVMEPESIDEVRSSSSTPLQYVLEKAEDELRELNS